MRKPTSEVPSCCLSPQCKIHLFCFFIVLVVSLYTCLALMLTQVSFFSDSKPSQELLMQLQLYPGATFRTASIFLQLGKTPWTFLMWIVSSSSSRISQFTTKDLMTLWPTCSSSRSLDNSPLWLGPVALPSLGWPTIISWTWALSNRLLLSELWYLSSRTL